MGLTVKSKGNKTLIYAINSSSYAEMTEIVESLIELHEVLFEDKVYTIIGYTDINGGVKTIGKANKLQKENDYGTRYCKLVLGDFTDQIPVDEEGLDFALDFELG